jgi:very-short-patch-repair endonuclease
MGEAPLRTADIRTTTRARSLRQADNDAEAALWSDLRARRLNGYKFVRQYPIGKYFADFACRDARLVVEVDGSQHAQSEYDRMRDEVMASLGWSVLRVWSADVLVERHSVLNTIVAALEGRLEPVAAMDLRFVLGRMIDGGEA